MEKREDCPELDGKEAFGEILAKSGGALLAVGLPPKREVCCTPEKSPPDAGLPLPPKRPGPPPKTSFFYSCLGFDIYLIMNSQINNYNINRVQ